MKKRSIVTALLLVLSLNVSGFSQSSNGSVGGIVQDPSGALVPGVTITLTNTGTGIVSTSLSNESGAYSFPSVAPGTYKLSDSFGDIASKGNQVRNFQGQVRFTF